MFQKDGGNITGVVENFDNRVSSGPKNRAGTEPKNKVKKEILDGWVEERRRKEHTGRTSPCPTMLGEKNTEGILLIGVACTDPTWLGPMLDLGVKRLTKKRRNQTTNSGKEKRRKPEERKEEGVEIWKKELRKEESKKKRGLEKENISPENTKLSKI